MTLDERCNLVLAFARTLFVNGQATDQTVAGTERLSRALGLRGNLMARWGELQLYLDRDNGVAVYQVAADPAGVDMDRVASAMRTIEDVEGGRIAPELASKVIGAIS
jgi:uncharacterized membrane protein YjjP (DUF1212 family)